MDCQFCKDPVKAWDSPRTAHLILSQNGDKHVHVHGDLDKREIMENMILEAQGTLGIGHVPSKRREIKEVIFHNRQRIGDMLMFTCGVRDFKKAFPDTRVNVISIAPHIWDNNPYIDRTLEKRFTDTTIEKCIPADFPEKTNVIKIGPGWLTNASNRLDWHFANAYRVSIEQALGVSIPQGLSRPDIWFTEEEYNAPRITKEPYWIIVTGGEPGWAAKMYPHEKWQEFVDQNPDKIFYHLGTKGDNPPRLRGPNVVDYVGRTEDKDTGIRDLYKLFLNAEGSVGLVSFHMHLSGALWKPAVIIAGGREAVSFTRYEGHRYLSTDGCLPCAVKACWACSLEPGDTRCKSIIEYPDRVQRRVPQCVDIITPDDLTREINRYYQGGRLIKGVASEKTPKNMVNIVKTPVKIAVPEVQGVTCENKDSALQKQVTKKYGEIFKFGGGSISEKDWQFLQSVLKTYNVKSVLEFGCGLSTLLFAEEGMNVTSYETMKHWIERVVEKAPSVNINRWDGKDTELSGKFDFAFVDGPAGGENREHSVRIASEHADIIVVHDGNFGPEKKWQEKYLLGKFNGPLKCGDRSNLWFKDSGPAITVTPVTTKKIRIVSTARGWGGCARSVTTIMKMLLSKGHEVEFVPFRNSVSSREFKECIEKELGGLTVTPTYETLNDPCDTLLVYADDYVWEFDKLEIFNSLNAKRKVMMVNYRRGKIGQVPWTRDWDLYAFLNTQQEKDLLQVHPGVKTIVLPPCTKLEPFLEVKPDYGNGVRIVRHNSQGDTKFEESERDRIFKSLEDRQDLTISMLPGPSYAQETDRFKKVKRTADPTGIASFLSTGNLFWYSLPKGYMDMGPRVILEAMASGLPVIADNWGGAPDRVTPETGWICNTKEEQLEIIKNVTNEELKAKGEAARKRAVEEFVPEKWLEVLDA